jgi:P27 family predicted phage terminase small subunit
MPGNKNSGRRPQPTALKLLRGNPGKRPLNQNEPQPEPVGESFDVPPAALDGDAVAAAEWARLAPMLRRAGMVTEAERTSLVALCQQWSRYLKAQGNVMQVGMVVMGKNGQPFVNPYLGVADKALTHCCKLWSELGLTPSSRSRISALPKMQDQAVSKWAGFL